MVYVKSNLHVLLKQFTLNNILNILSFLNNSCSSCCGSCFNFLKTFLEIA